MVTFDPITVHKPLKLYLVWKDPEGRHHEVGWFNETHFQYHADLHKAKAQGFKEHPAFVMSSEDPQRLYKNPVALLGKRCPPRHRVDYRDYLQAFCLNPDITYDDFTLLAYTGGRISGDPFHVVNKLEGIQEGSRFIIQLAGCDTHYFKAVESPLSPEAMQGLPLTLVPEPENEYDPHAMSVTLQGTPLGYIHRVLAEPFHTWHAQQRIESIRIYRVNGTHDHRYVYAYVTLYADATKV
ncbi:MAG: hypothetical protein ACKO37_07520 [Vampirovibrionales bacterium]